MATEKLTFKIFTDENGIKYLRYACPGCNYYHDIPITGDKKWKYNDDIESPTLTQSVKTQYGRDGRNGICHHFLRNGKIEFLSDCTHKLSGQVY